MIRHRPVSTRFLVAAAAVAVSFGATLGGLGGLGTAGSPVPDSPDTASGAPTDTTSSAAPATPVPPTSPSPAPIARLLAPAATATPVNSPSPVPLVPIVNYWSSRRSISRIEIAALFAGMGPSPTDGPAPNSTVLAVSAGDIGPLTTLLGAAPRGVDIELAAQVRSRVKGSSNVIGIIRADDVTADVRALGVDGFQLFGAEHIRNPLMWPLTADEPGVVSSFLASSEWTIAAGGDVMLDKAVFYQSIARYQGVDYAWNGGTAVIDRRFCCGWGGKPLVGGRRTGDAGAVGDLFRSADLSIVNLESPEPDRFRYHASGFTFSGDPELLLGLADAGIDVAGLANNHIGNAGTRGVLDTIRHLDQLGISHAGAGTDQTTARKAAWLQAGGLRVAVLAYDLVDPYSYWAAPGHPGSAALYMTNVIRDIRAAKKAGADMVIVMPHWGIEYTDSVLPLQRTDASRMIAAGADLILGSHSHWVGPFEQMTPGHFVFYSLGDLVFDWTHDARTQEGAVADLTYVGKTLVQIDLHPTLIIQGQPNLLDPAGDGGQLLNAIRRTSEPRLHW